MQKIGKEFNDSLSAITKIGEENIELLEQLKEEGIKRLFLTSMGNSISTGFSFCDQNMPLLDRNALLEIMCEQYNIDLTKYKFARSENNSDQNTFNNIVNNLSEADINKLNRRDYEKQLKDGNPLLSEEEIEKYYGGGNTTPIQDIIFDDDELTANIVIYNGCTGSFLDNVTRGGKHKLTNGIEKDLCNVDAVLNLIHNNNRETEATTQVYLCGAPRVLNTGIQDHFINKKLQKLAKRYPHVNYVDNFKRHMIYKGNAKVDLHYDKTEYLKLTHLLMRSMIENYVLTDRMIDVDRELYKTNKYLEMNNKRDEDGHMALGEIGFMAASLDFLEGYPAHFEEEFLRRMRDYFLERYCYDFFCFDKENVKKYIMSSSAH